MKRFCVIAVVALSLFAVAPQESEAGPLRCVARVAKAVVRVPFRAVKRVAKARPLRRAAGAVRGGCSGGSCG